MFAASLVFTITACNSPRLWGLSRDEFLHALEVRDYKFLEGVDPAQYESALSFGDEVPYCLALHMTRAGRAADARAFFKLGAEKSPEPYRGLCADALTRTGTDEERLASVEALLAALNAPATAAVPTGTTAVTTAPVAAKPNALSDAERAARIDRLGRLRDSLLLSLGRYAEVFGSDTAAAITSVRSDVYRRSYREAWAKARPLLEALLPPSERTKAQSGKKSPTPASKSAAKGTSKSAASGTKSSGQSASQAALPPAHPEILSSRAVLSDFGKAALYGAAKPEDAADLFDRLAAVAVKDGNPETRHLLAFYAGRMYGSGSEKSIERFEAALKFAQSDDDHDSSLWYLFDSALAVSPERFLSEFELYAKTWKDSSFFDDIIEPFIVKEARVRDWNALMKLRDSLPEDADKDIRARLDYLAARSKRYDSEATVEAYLAAFKADRTSLYYRVLAAESLGIAPESDSGFFAGIKSAVAPEQKADPEKEKLLRALVTYHLDDYVYPVAVKFYPDCPPKLARELASLLTAKGLYGDSIRLVLMAVHASAEPISKEDLEFMYPRPWHAEVAAASVRFGVPEYVIYALIRTESYFVNDAVSGVGAQGLTQLMKPTAADIAGRLGVESFDLADPATNILFGSYYLSTLVKRLDGNTMSALYAYNAGITKVRLWLKDAGYDGSESGDIVLEGLPYAETREYGRKVLAAAAVYGYLYYQKSTGDVVRELF